MLSLDPLIILLDEPTAGMTREERRLTAELVKRMASIASVVVVEHDMDFVRSLASPTIVLHQGRIMTAGTIEEIRRDPRVLDVYLGRRAEYAAENPH